MCFSIFLAQVLGIYLILTSLSTLIHQRRYKKVTADFLLIAPLIALSGSLLILFGLLILIPHNLWVAQWPVVITIIGWIFLLRGIQQLFFPDAYARMTKNFLERKGFLLLAWFWLLVGIYLLWAGFTQA